MNDCNFCKGDNMIISTLYPDLDLSLQTTKEEIKNYFLAQVRPILDTTVSFAINSATCSYLTLVKEHGLLEKIKNNPPQCISYQEDYNYSQHFEQTVLYDAIKFMPTEYLDKNDVEQYTELYRYIFNITQDEVIGYTLYLHYPSVTYKYEIGLQVLFSLEKNDFFESMEQTDHQDLHRECEIIDESEELDDDLDKRFKFYDESEDVAREVGTYLIKKKFIHIATTQAEALDVIKKYCVDMDRVKQLARYTYYEQDVFFNKVYSYCITKLQSKKVQKLFNQAKINEEVMFAKDYEQRLTLAKSLFTEEDIQFIEPEKISDMLLRAKHYYEINFIPQKVKELAESNMSHKAIAEQLGTSIAKVKKYLSSK